MPVNVTLQSYPNGHDGHVHPVDPVERLQRWEELGTVWVVARSDTELTISLCRCDDGEEVERFSSADPALHAYVDRITGSAEA